MSRKSISWALDTANNIDFLFKYDTDAFFLFSKHYQSEPGALLFTVVNSKKIAFIKIPHINNFYDKVYLV